MIYFNGFSLQDEQGFFADFIDESDFCICGFSYGAIKAFEFTLKNLKDGKRVDKLQLFSPAFFHGADERFVKLQLLGYKKGSSSYIEQFITNSFLPYKKSDIVLGYSDEEQLRELLEYRWSEDELKFLLRSGVVLEVYIGGEDHIIDVQKAMEFFLTFASLTYIKKANHFLEVK
ncbi:MAG: pimelyl-ACP methyl ester esterase BioV [Sulfurimonas sp.]